MERKYIIALAFLSVLLLAGIFVVACQREGLMALGSSLSRVFADDRPWMEIKPRAVADPVVGVQSSASDTSKTSAPKTKKASSKTVKTSKVVAALKTVAKNTNAKTNATKIIDPAIKLCAVDGGLAQREVVINEVAWMGSLKSYSDEWIELKNISGQSVNLAGWQLQNKNQKIKIIFGANDIIAPGGFYLLERTDDDSVAEVAADKVYSGGLGNSNEALYLFGADCLLQDSVAAAPKWPAGDNAAKKTMERMSNLLWQTSVMPGGTPKAENK
jgi:hypothetical protein